MLDGPLFLAGDSGAWLTLSNGEFLPNIRFEPEADADLVRAAANADSSAFARRLTRLLAPAAKPHSKGRYWPSLWSLSAFPPEIRARELARELFTKGFAKQPAPRSSETQRAGRERGRSNARVDRKTDPADALLPFELLCLFDLLMERGRELPPEELFSTWKRAAIFASLLFTDLDEDAGCAAPPDLRLLVAGELRWKAGLLFRGLRGDALLRDAGRAALATALIEGTDTDGTPSAEFIDRLALWLAPLVRSAEWGERFNRPLWEADHSERFRHLVGRVAPLCRANGRLALSNDFPGGAIQLLATASRIAGFKKSSRPYALIAAVSAAQRKLTIINGRANGRAKLSADQLPATQSDWARLACLRSDWSAAADAFVVAHHRAAPLIELSTRGVPLLEGEWEIAVSIDGRPVKLDSEWGCSCWHSDSDVDFIELQMEFANGLHIERQALLSRDDHWLLLADCVAAPQDVRIEYSARLPVVADVAASSSRESRAIKLAGGKITARVFPLALPQDWVHGTSGALAADADGRLELRQSSMGGLFAPLLIDWSPRRRTAPADWRTLTVTENRRVLSSAEAAGHRIRIGDRQLAIYHSLRKGTFSRAVLGIHTSNETVVSRLAPGGEVQPLLLVE